jgi:hypothetical protein
LLGSTDKELADFFLVSEDSVHEWKKVHTEFSESITRGKMLADAEVAASLFKRATGMTVKEMRLSGGGGGEDGDSPSATETTKEIPPDTQAASLWLRNRQSAKWRDKQEIEHGGTIAVMSAAERDARIAELLAKKR